MPIRAVRGATTVESDNAEQIGERLGELYDALTKENNIDSFDIVSCLITATSDIHSVFPALALRKARGINDVPVIGALEIDAEGGLPLTLRIMVTIESEKPKSEITHIYLHGAANLRPDLSGK